MSDNRTVKDVPFMRYEIDSLIEFDRSGFRGWSLKEAEAQLLKAQRALKRRANQLVISPPAMMINCEEAHKIVRAEACAILMSRGKLEKWAEAPPHVYVFNY